MSEFERVSGSVATNIQKLVQNVSSMQRMMVHVDSQVHHHLSLLRDMLRHRFRKSKVPETTPAPAKYWVGSGSRRLRLQTQKFVFLIAQKVYC